MDKQPAVSFLEMNQVQIIAHSEEYTPRLNRMTAAKYLWRQLTDAQRDTYLEMDHRRHVVVSHLFTAASITIEPTPSAAESDDEDKGHVKRTRNKKQPAR
jgi:hypothetical protein